MEFAEIYTLYIQTVNNEVDLARGFDDFLRPFINSEILDTSCGTGFLTLELIKRGYNITCNDGSPKMLEMFRMAARKKKMSVEPFPYNWNTLEDHFSNRFDVLLCRGNSLVYYNCWDEADQPIAEDDELIAIFRNFLNCLTAGGVFYFDLPAQIKPRTDGEKHQPLHRNFSSKIINGQHVTVEEEVTCLIEKMLRVWNLQISIDGRNFSFARNSRLLTPEDTAAMLRKVGFRKIESVKIPGERENFISFLARK